MHRDDEIDKELQFHVDARIDDLIAEGVTVDEARRRARLEFGGVMQTKEAVRDLGVWSIVNGLAQDLRFAFRTLRPAAQKRPRLPGAAFCLSVKTAYAFPATLRRRRTRATAARAPAPIRP